jgi:hypothetical protein
MKKFKIYIIFPHSKRNLKPKRRQGKWNVGIKETQNKVVYIHHIINQKQNNIRKKKTKQY